MVEPPARSATERFGVVLVDVHGDGVTLILSLGECAMIADAKVISEPNESRHALQL